jgi:hypothetical protein
MALPAPLATDAGWPGSAGGPTNARFNALAHPGTASPAWQLSFQPQGESAISPVTLAAQPATIFAVDTLGRLLRINAASGQVAATAMVWPYGPLGAVQGARIAIIEDVVAVSAADAYAIAESKLPYFRVKLAFFDAQSLARLWELPGQVGRDYQILAQRGQVAVTTDNDTIALYAARSGQLLWQKTDAMQQFHLLAATADTIFVRSVSTAPPEQRGPYTQRQVFLALDWATGAMRWEIRPELTDDVTAAMADSSHLYLLAFPGKMLAVNAHDGSELWHVEDGPALLEGNLMALGYGKLFGVQAADLAVVAFDATSGQKVWQTPLAGAQSAPTLAVADGRVYLVVKGKSGAYLEMLDANTGKQPRASRWPSSPRQPSTQIWPPSPTG